MSAPLPEMALVQLRAAGLARPRSPQAGQAWTPSTKAEQHLLSEAQRLDRLRLLLLEEIGRLRHQAPRPSRTQVLEAVARTAVRLRECPLTPMLLAVVEAAAAGDSVEDTARRLSLAYDTVKTHRQRAVSRLQARSVSHAVALCVAAGWITPGQAGQGAPS